MSVLEEFFDILIGNYRNKRIQKHILTVFVDLGKCNIYCKRGQNKYEYSVSHF